MDQSLYEMIFKRKSFHIFRGESREITEAECVEITEAYKGFEPLDPSVKTAIRIVPERETTCKRGGQYCILLYSEEKENALQNIGYLGEQLDLYLVSKNIATLWFGIGKPDESVQEGMPFVIMIAIQGRKDASSFRKDMFQSRRRPVDEIWQGEKIEGVSEIVRFAPSACNSQPWLAKRKGELLEVYRFRKEGKRGIMPKEKVTYFNRIDLGIFLCFLELCLENRGIRFERTLYADHGGEEELTLAARYVLKGI